MGQNMRHIMSHKIVRQKNVLFCHKPKPRRQKPRIWEFRLTFCLPNRFWIGQVVKHLPFSRLPFVSFVHDTILRHMFCPINNLLSQIKKKPPETCPHFWSFYVSTHLLLPATNCFLSVSDNVHNDDDDKNNSFKTVWKRPGRVWWNWHGRVVVPTHTWRNIPIRYVPHTYNITYMCYITWHLLGRCPSVVSVDPSCPCCFSYQNRPILAL